MEAREVTLLENEGEKSSILSRNSKITELLELCTQPKNKKETKTIVSIFWKYVEIFSRDENLKKTFCEFDICCMLAFEYLYKENSESLAAVSRTVCAYLVQNGLALKDDNRNHFINGGNDCYLTGLPKITNFESEEGMVILVQSLMSCLINGNMAFAHFLAKFGFVDFPSEANEKSRKMVVELVNWFNISYEYIILNMQEDMTTFIQVDELLNQLTQSEISFRRSVLVFCTLCIIVEYMKYEKVSMIDSCFNAFANRKKSKCMANMSCLYLFIDTTTETKITFKDIEIFTATVLNQQLSTEFRRTLVETSRKIMTEAQGSYNPRTLKDLTRCKIRACVPSSMMLTEQVNQLTIPKTLKQFILFHSEEIWEFMIHNHGNLLLVQQLNRHLTEMQNEFGN